MLATNSHNKRIDINSIENSRNIKISTRIRQIIQQLSIVHVTLVQLIHRKWQSYCQNMTFNSYGKKLKWETKIWLNKNLVSEQKVCGSIVVIQQTSDDNEKKNVSISIQWLDIGRIRYRFINTEPARISHETGGAHENGWEKNKQ